MPHMKPIVQKGEPVLRNIAEPVDPEHISSPEIQQVLADMREALESQEDGVALAAPQIGISLRIFIIAPKVFEEGTGKEPEHLVYINPEVIKRSRKKSEMTEGCLSVRPWYGAVVRSEKARVRALDEHGNRFEYGGSDLLAQIFQHEIDHLDGILFIDKATHLEELPQEKEARDTAKKDLQDRMKTN